MEVKTCEEDAVLRKHGQDKNEATELNAFENGLGISGNVLGALAHGHWEHESDVADSGIKIGEDFSGAEVSSSEHDPKSEMNQTRVLSFAPDSFSHEQDKKIAIEHEEVAFHIDLAETEHGHRDQNPEGAGSKMYIGEAEVSSSHRSQKSGMDSSRELSLSHRCNAVSEISNSKCDNRRVIVAVSVCLVIAAILGTALGISLKKSNAPLQIPLDRSNITGHYGSQITSPRILEFKGFESLISLSQGSLHFKFLAVNISEGDFDASKLDMEYTIYFSPFNGTYNGTYDNRTAAEIIQSDKSKNYSFTGIEGNIYDPALVGKMNFAATARIQNTFDIKFGEKTMECTIAFSTPTVKQNISFRNISDLFPTDFTYDDGNNTISFSSNVATGNLSTTLQNKVGSVFYLQTGQDYKYLRLLQIQEVRRDRIDQVSGVVYNVKVEELSLLDLFDSIEIFGTFQEPFLFQMDSSAVSTRRAQEYVSFGVSHEVAVEEGPVKASFKISLDSTLTYSYQQLNGEVTFVVECMWKWSLQHHAVFSLLERAFKKEVALSFPKRTYLLWIPTVVPIPVLISFKPIVNIGLEGEARMVLEAHTSFSSSRTIRVSYEKEAWTHSNVANPIIKHMDEENFLAAEGSLQSTAYILLGVEAGVASLLSCTAAIRPYTELNAGIELSSHFFANNNDPFPSRIPFILKQFEVKGGLTLTVEGRMKAFRAPLFRSESALAAFDILPPDNLAIRARGFSCTQEKRKFVSFEGVVSSGQTDAPSSRDLKWYVDQADGIVVQSRQANVIDIILETGRETPTTLVGRKLYLFATSLLWSQRFLVMSSLELDNSELPQCCSDGECSSRQQCDAGACVNRGNPRFSLYWEGTSDLDLHVKTPGGFEIFFAQQVSTDGGRLDVDRIPEQYGYWIENVYWPPDGSAPLGRYEYWVRNYNGVRNAWTIRVFLLDSVIAEHTGYVDNHEDSIRFTHDNT